MTCWGSTGKENASVPEISVIIPVYNSVNYFEKCLESMKTQTFRNFEIIIVDDKSTDGSAEKFDESLRSLEIPYKIIRHSQNRGPGVARNTGIGEAAGNWIVFIDNDDWVTEDFLENLHNIAIEQQADIVVCNYIKYWSDKNCQKKRWFKFNVNSAVNKDECLALSGGSLVSRIIRASLFKENKIWFPDMRAAEDYAVWPRLVAKAKKIYYCESYMYYYLQRQTSISNSEISDPYSFIKALNYYKNDLAPCYNRELQFRALMELFYMTPLIMIKFGLSRKEIVQFLKAAKREFPKDYDTPYFKTVVLSKRLFIMAAWREYYPVLLVMTRLHTFLNNVRFTS